MTKILAAALLVASFLLALPVVESATSSTQVFQAIGTADGGGGGD